MNVPFTAIHFATYESCKKLLALHEDESLAVQLAAGGTAGGVSAALTTPLDVVKTRLQLEGVNSATRYRTTALVRCWLTAIKLIATCSTVFDYILVALQCILYILHDVFCKSRAGFSTLLLLLLQSCITPFLSMHFNWSQVC